MIVLVLIAAAGGLAVAVAAVLAVLAVLAVHIIRRERRSGRGFRQICSPLPPGPVPMSDTDPDGPGAGLLRLPFLDRGDGGSRAVATGRAGKNPPPSPLGSLATTYPKRRRDGLGTGGSGVRRMGRGPLARARRRLLADRIGSDRRRRRSAPRQARSGGATPQRLAPERGS
ncbi:hypothetical protein [Amycolatopsis rubida]|uniref:hypothetical protein n=1 Tax=Amycolatopsis rubida TaxID=112413 RepID=UPI000B819BF1|nr:hypothetical protein [Amycolatopsis rubida]